MGINSDLLSPQDNDDHGLDIMEPILEKTILLPRRKQSLSTKQLVLSIWSAGLAIGVIIGLFRSIAVIKGDSHSAPISLSPVTIHNVTVEQTTVYEPLPLAVTTIEQIVKPYVSSIPRGTTYKPTTTLVEKPRHPATTKAPITHSYPPRLTPSTLPSDSVTSPPTTTTTVTTVSEEPSSIPTNSSN